MNIITTEKIKYFLKFIFEYYTSKQVSSHFTYSNRLEIANIIPINYSLIRYGTYLVMRKLAQNIGMKNYFEHSIVRPSTGKCVLVGKLPWKCATCEELHNASVIETRSKKSCRLFGGLVLCFL